MLKEQICQKIVKEKRGNRGNKKTGQTGHTGRDGARELKNLNGTGRGAARSPRVPLPTPGRHYFYW